MRPNTQTSNYTFASQPRPVSARAANAAAAAAKYRDPSMPQAPANIMFDRRVVRGNTFANPKVPANAAPNASSLAKQVRAYRQEQAATAMNQAHAMAHVPRTPEPVDGRTHIEVQTELYLEEITDRVVEVTVETQTDAFMDRPASPLFMPQKTGVDASTQIQHGDLFDFDLEVEPLLCVLVGKTLEQSLMEVLEEEELSQLRAHQTRFEQQRNAQLADVQRMEAAEARRAEEKKRRLAQERERLEREKQATEKVAARGFAEKCFADMRDTVFSGLRQAGYFYDPVQREVEVDFMPWLSQRVKQHTDRDVLATTLLEELLAAAQASRATMPAAAVEAAV